MSTQAAATSEGTPAPDQGVHAGKNAPAEGAGATTDTTTTAPAEGDPPAEGTTPAEGEPAEGVGSVLGGEQGQPGGETTGPADGVELEVTLPEGVEVDEGMLESFKAIGKEVGLDSEKASKLAAWYSEKNQEATTAAVAAWNKQGEDWGKSLESDPDIGGQKFEASKASAQRAVLRFGGPELAAELERHGVGNLPVLVKAFVRIGDEFSEDTTSGPASGGGRQELSKGERLDVMYPSTKVGG